MAPAISSAAARPTWWMKRVVCLRSRAVTGVVPDWGQPTAGRPGSAPHEATHPRAAAAITRRMPSDLSRAGDGLNPGRQVMRCPFCGADDSQVRDSRPTEEGSAIRRRRSCPNCAARFTTFERVQLRELTVIKKNGQREPFDRDKLARSIHTALRKRPQETDRVERVINSIVRQLESSGEPELPSDMIGELVMEALVSLDQVAYIRFASVYRNFREAKDFGEFVGQISADGD